MAKLILKSEESEQVFKQNIFSSTGTTTLDISQFAAGIYFMEVYDGVKYYTRKFIVEQK